MSAGADCSGAAIGAEVLVSDCASSMCEGQGWMLVANKGGPKGSRKYQIRSAHNTSDGKPMCLQLQEGGAALSMCDTVMW
jgi:hypothetical protein